MGVALHLVPVHVRAGVAFVGIADDVFLVGFRIPGDPPLEAGGETGTAPAPEPDFSTSLMMVSESIPVRAFAAAA